MKQLLEKLADNFDITSPATDLAIETAERHFSIKFPKDYKDFLQFTNGLEGENAESYLVLWSAEELVELNQAYNVKEFVANVMLIGSDGAEEAFGFETTDMTVVKLPFIGMGYIANEKLSDTFIAFLSSHIKAVNRGFFTRFFG